MLFRSDRKSTRLNSSHLVISYAVFCLKKKTTTQALRVNDNIHDAHAPDTRAPRSPGHLRRERVRSLWVCHSVTMVLVFFFFFNDTATTEIYTLSLHDALPI